jgi:hypothetical protein
MIYDNRLLKEEDLPQTPYPHEVSCRNGEPDPRPHPRPEKDLHAHTATLLIDLLNTIGAPDTKARREEERLEQLGDEFVGHIIEEYERVVRHGLLPNRAIANVLEWASCECLRIVPPKS